MKSPEGHGGSWASRGGRTRASWPRLRRSIAAVLCALAGLQSLAPAAAAPGLSLVINSVDASEFPRVTAYVTVLNEHGQPVLGLGPNDFEVTEGDLPARDVAARPLVNSQEALSAVVVVDVSGSMDGDALAAAKAAASSFVTSLGPRDRVGLLAFSSGVRQVQAFTDDRGALLRGLEGLQAGGNTALYDALFAGLETAIQAGVSRRIVVLETDGRDTGSRKPLDDSIRMARENGISVFTIGLGRDLDRDMLSQIAQSTGGSALFAPTPSELERAYRSVTEQLRSQYAVSHSSPAPQGSGTYRMGITVRQGLASASGETQFSANPPPPVIRGLSLQDGAVLPEAADLTVEVESARAVTRVSFEIDGQQIAGTAAQPYTVRLRPEDLSEGRHELGVTVVDAAGSRATKSLAFTVPPGPMSTGAQPPEAVSASSRELLSFRVPGSLNEAGEYAGELAGNLMDAVAARVHTRLVLSVLLMAVAAVLAVFSVRRFLTTAHSRLRAVTCPDCGQTRRAYDALCRRCLARRHLAEVKRRSLRSVLLENGLLDERDLEACLAESVSTGKSLARALLDSGKITEEQLSRAHFYAAHSNQIAERKAEAVVVVDRSKVRSQLPGFLPSILTALLALVACGLAIPLANQ